MIQTSDGLVHQDEFEMLKSQFQEDPKPLQREPDFNPIEEHHMNPEEQPSIMIPEEDWKAYKDGTHGLLHDPNGTDINTKAVPIQMAREYQVAEGPVTESKYLSPAERQNWNDTWEQAVPAGSNPTQQVPDGYEGMLYNKEDMEGPTYLKGQNNNPLLFIRPYKEPGKTPINPKDLTSDSGEYQMAGDIIKGPWTATIPQGPQGYVGFGPTNPPPVVAGAIAPGVGAIKRPAGK